MKKEYILTEELKNKIEVFYKNGNSLIKCEKEFNIPNHIIYKFIKKIGINRSRLESKSISKEKEKAIIKFYLEGNSHFKCQKKFGTTRKTSLNILKKYNIPRRSFEESNKIHTYDKFYFENIDTKDKAYFLGWMVSDGYNSGEKICLSIQKGDIDILKIFKNKINYSGNIVFDKNKKKEHYKILAKISIYDKKLSQDLIKLGVIPKKSHYTYFPDIPEEFHSHFIRGVFDGDGCIFIGEKIQVFGITGNLKLIKTIQELLIKNCNLKENKLLQDKRCNGNIYNLKYGGNKQVKKIYTWLYKDCEDLYLTRKKEKFEKIWKKLK